MAAAAVQIPKTHRGAVYDKPGTNSLKVEEALETPEPGTNEVLIKLSHSGVCHSDYSVMTNAWSFLPFPTQPGQVGGHEGVGEVVKLGPGADQQVKIGDRVGIKWMAGTCGTCRNCLLGHDVGCPSGRISGYYTPGTFQQYALGPAAYVTKIPDGLDSASAAPMLCGGVTTYAAIKKCGARPGEWVAVLGAGGGLGHIAVQLASKGFGYRVIGIDHSSKRDLVMATGAEHFFAIDQTADMAKAVLEVTQDWGCASSIVLTSNMKAYEMGMTLLGMCGRLMAVGIPENNLDPIVGSAPQQMIGKQLEIRAIGVGNRQDAIECLDMAARGVVKMHFETKKLEDLQGIFTDMEQGKVKGRVVLDLSS